MKDNYARNIFIVMVLSMVCLSVLIGFISGLVIIKVDSSLEDQHTANLMIIYGVDK